MNLFVYGTLIDAEIMRTVAGDDYVSERATLSGYVRRRVSGEVYPAIIECPGASVSGITYLDVNPNTVDTEIGNEIEVRIPEEVGINVLAGVDYPIMNDKLSVFVEANYRNIKTKANSTDIRDFNVDMTGVGAAFGLVLNF